MADDAATGRSGPSRRWRSQPETSDDAVQEATGRGYDEWCDIIEDWGDDGGDLTDHAAVAAHLQSEWNVDGWWAQTVTVGYERITGRRLPHQRADGTFAVSKSGRVAIEADELRRMLLDEQHRTKLFPGQATALRSKPTAKALRIEVGPGVAVFGITDLGDGHSKVSVQHQKLPTYDRVEEWRSYWTEWFDALADALDVSSG